MAYCQSPKSIAPGLFALARRKNLIVKDALFEGRWISWKLMADGQYSAASACDFQFLTWTPDPVLNAIWKVKSDPEVSFYMRNC